MIIKSVREISFFQNLRDKDISLCFCNFIPNKNSDEVVHFMSFLLSVTENDLKENPDSQLSYLEKDCLDALSAKLKKYTQDINYNYNHVKATVGAFKTNSCCSHSLQISGKVTLSFVELIHLYYVVEYFENNFDSFNKFIKNNTIPHQLLSFTSTPSSYYNAIYYIKNKLEHKLGELIVTSYKIKNN